MDKRVYLCLAHMSGREQDFIREAFDTNWVVPLGPNVNAFEEELGAFLGGGKRVVALSAGTAAIHLGLVLLGVGPATRSSASRSPSVPRPIRPSTSGRRPSSWTANPGAGTWIPSCSRRPSVTGIARRGRKPKAIIPVHLYGMPADIDAICRVAERYGIPVLEDAAEALGSEFEGRKCGTFGALGALSFNGNKMITTSGGGALIVPDDETDARAMFFATQAREPFPYYQHEQIGYNYRMSNICAGIGRGQMTVLDAHIAHHRRVHARYAAAFAGVPGITLADNPDSRWNSNFWLCTILVDPAVSGTTCEELRLRLDAEGVETRPLWKPMHLQPVYAGNPCYVNGTAERLFGRGLCLPAGPMVTDDDVDRIAACIRACVKSPVA